MITLRKVSKVYENGKRALINVNLSLPRVGFVSILGESGSGKTTLLNLLAFNDERSCGDITYNGVNIDEMNDSEKYSYIGYIHQDYKLIESMTVLENIMISVELSNSNYDTKKVIGLLKELDIEQHKDSKVVALSGGEKQRVAIAKAIAREPKVIFADEPTGNLDDDNTKNILDILKEISKNVLVVMVTHDKENAKKYSDYIVKLKFGRVVENNLPDCVDLEDKLYKDKSYDYRQVLSKDNIEKISKSILNSNIKSHITHVIICAILIMINVFMVNMSMQSYTNYLVSYYNTNNSNMLVVEPTYGFLDLKNEVTNAGYKTVNITPDEWYQFYYIENGVIIRDKMSKYIVSTDNIGELKLPLLYGRYPENDNEYMISHEQFQDFAKRKKICCRFCNECIEISGDAKKLFNHYHDNVRLVGVFDEYMMNSGIIKYKNRGDFLNFYSQAIVSNENFLRNQSKYYNGNLSGIWQRIEYDIMFSDYYNSEKSSEMLNVYEYRSNILPITDVKVYNQYLHEEYSVKGLFDNYLDSTRDLPEGKILLTQKMVNNLRNKNGEPVNIQAGDKIYLDFGYYKEIGPISHTVPHRLDNQRIEFEILDILDSSYDKYGINAMSMKDFLKYSNNYYPQPFMVGIIADKINKQDIKTLDSIAEKLMASEGTDVYIGIGYDYSCKYYADYFQAVSRGYSMSINEAAVLVAPPIIAIASIIYVFYILYTFRVSIRDKGEYILVLRTQGMDKHILDTMLIKQMLVRLFIEVIIGVILGVILTIMIDIVLSQIIEITLFIIPLLTWGILILVVSIILFNCAVIYMNRRVLYKNNIRQTYGSIAK